MALWELLLIGVGLSMDAFAVSICKGLTARQATLGRCLTAGAYFGGFQALMPLLGYLLGTRLEAFIVNVDHWIAFLLLGVIGFNMVREAGKEEEVDPSFGPGAMLPLAVATSIDALAVGLGLAAVGRCPNIWQAAGLIATCTFGLSLFGVALGRRLGARLAGKAGVLGGLILIGIGLKMLI